MLSREIISGTVFFIFTKMKRIAVFCGSSTGFNGIYRDHAQRLGKALAEKNIELIYGGGKVGLMGVIADAVLDAGGRVIGVIPDFLDIKEVAHEELTEMYRVDTMHERKDLIHKMSDGAIALPGGFGTLDELFEMLTWGQLGLHQKPVGLLNINDYYSHILVAIETMVREGFLKEINRELVLVSQQIDDLLGQMNRYIAPEVPKWIVD